MGARLLVTAAVAVTLGWGASGCGEDPPEPAASDSASQSSSESPSDTDSESASPSDSSSSTSESPAALEEPTPPPAMQGDDAAAAEAFIEYCFDLLNYSQATGDVRTLRTLGLPSCKQCRGGADGLAQIYQRGGRLEGGLNRAASVEVTGRKDLGKAGLFYVNVDLARTDERVIERSGKVQEYEGGLLKIRYQLVSDSRGIRLVRWDMR